LFSPDKYLFLVFLLLFSLYATIIGSLIQAIALKFAYNEYNHRKTLFYSPFYFLLRLINAFARIASLIKYLRGERGGWNKNSY
jgi:hypothetical protein